MPIYTPQYIDYTDIENYTRGKIVISGTPEPSEYSQAFINDLCAKGESVVERDFNKIYLTPFQNQGGGAFTTLPSDTQAYLVNLFIIQTVILLLSIDFGANSAVIGENYLTHLKSYYKTEKEKILTKTKDGLYAHYLLSGLAINPLSFTGQTTSPTPKIINPLLNNNNSQKAALRLTSVDKVIGRPGYTPANIIVDTDTTNG